MKYDFDSIIARRGSGSYKWDTPERADVLPMWVADMDFRTAPAIIADLERRVTHGVFGYVKVPDEYYEALIGWFERRHGWTFRREDVIYTSGVVPAISAIIKGLTRAGDGVIVQTPAYNCFFSSIRNNRCVTIDNVLLEHDGVYSIDFDQLERAATAARLMILCNPHNPVGRVWTEDELTRVAEICRRNNVVVISDEIHCELTYRGYDYTPFALIAEQVGTEYVVCNSPSKAFNTAGLQIANIVTPDADFRRRIDRAINDNEVCDVNPFGVVGLVAAYNEGADWLDELRKYLWDNYLAVKSFFAARLPQYRISPLEATYLLWINISASGMNGDEVALRLLDDCRVMVSPGSIYGSGGESYIRLNIATPRAILTDALQRMERVLKK